MELNINLEDGTIINLFMDRKQIGKLILKKKKEKYTNKKIFTNMNYQLNFNLVNLVDSYDDCFVDDKTSYGLELSLTNLPSD